LDLFLPQIAYTDKAGDHNPFRLMYCWTLFFKFYGWLSSSPVSVKKKRETQVNFPKKGSSGYANLSGDWMLLRRKSFYPVRSFPSNGLFKYFNFSIGPFIVGFFNRIVVAKASLALLFYPRATFFKNTSNSHPLAFQFTRKNSLGLSSASVRLRFDLRKSLSIRGLLL
jgi:hypothetical protein